ncbi:MAG TPA: type VI secretion system tube protein Hcp [Opitutaceae bacterium]|jgi:type VI secretion system Hcp family effector
MAFDAFLQIPGVSGESTDAQHKGWIELQEYAFGFEMAVNDTRSDSGSPATGRVKVNEFTAKKKIDAASAPLMLLVASGKLFDATKSSDDIVVELFRATGTKELYATIKLKGGIFTKLDISGSGDELPSEDLAISAGEFDFCYQQYSKEGKKVAQKGMKWSQFTNSGSNY